jgi:glycosyltransferase involved in cell wall biosynthesis
MIVVYHQNNKVCKIVKNQIELSFEINNVAENLMFLARSNLNELLIWCHLDLKPYLNDDAFENVFHHHKIMASFGCNNQDYLSDTIGYIEESVFLKINKEVTYPTWRMSSLVGGIFAEMLLEFDGKIKLDQKFDYFLHSLAKVGIPKGLLCYSEPKLIKDNSVVVSSQKASSFDLFKFAKQHYRTRWTFFLFFCFLIFEKRLPLLPLLFSLRFQNRQNNAIDLAKIKVHSKLKVIDLKTIDVIIPTIGRKKYLYDVLQDLAQQTHLPKNVIIVEQNPDIESSSELEYLTAEEWPFYIKHIFTHQSGACNARNVALDQVSSEWVFLNDDDNRFDKNLFHDAFSKIEQFGTYVATTSYIQPNEKLAYKITNQSGIFGSGNSFVKSSCLKNVSFSMALEFGYGEDTDFGMQLRNQGFDVIYFPELKIIHLKAPFGGFRITPKFVWSDEIIQPKPSPTLMYVKQKYLLQKQVSGYKLILFLKMIKKESLLSWFSFYSLFQKKWLMSLKWSEKL